MLGGLAGLSPLQAGSGWNPVDLKDRYGRLLFDGYLPFWDRGGIDREFGGFMCYLFDDGSVQDERKDIWYQGRGIWVYSRLFQVLDPDERWLDVARAARDFMVKHMHRGNGDWHDTVDRRGSPVTGKEGYRSQNIYGALFAAVGLLAYADASGDAASRELALTTIQRARDRYESPDYSGVQVPNVGNRGLRAQGHAFSFIWTLNQVADRDASLDAYLQEQLDRLASSFWNPDYGISNEYLDRQYRRLPGWTGFMAPGHSIEAQWMALEAARGLGKETLARTLADRMHRLIELCWDWRYGGVGDKAYHAEPTATAPVGTDFSIKTMWAQTEVMLGCLKVIEAYREPWAYGWFLRTEDFVLRTMRTGTGVWRQAVDRQGRNKSREGISPYRKGNFHQPRMLMEVVRGSQEVL